LLALEKTVRQRVIKVMNDRVANLEDPSLIAKPLLGTYKGLHRFRVGDYRVICDIQRERVLVLVLTVGHRKDVYQ
jgi:mRNA interferase RelE/StbE